MTQQESGAALTPRWRLLFDVAVQDFITKVRNDRIEVKTTETKLLETAQVAEDTIAPKSTISTQNSTIHQQLLHDNEVHETTAGSHRTQMAQLKQALELEQGRYHELLDEKNANAESHFTQKSELKQTLEYERRQYQQLLDEKNAVVESHCTRETKLKQTLKQEQEQYQQLLEEKKSNEEKHETLRDELRRSISREREKNKASEAKCEDLQVELRQSISKGWERNEKLLEKIQEHEKHETLHDKLRQSFRKEQERNEKLLENIKEHRKNAGIHSTEKTNLLQALHKEEGKCRRMDEEMAELKARLSQEEAARLEQETKMLRATNTMAEELTEATDAVTALETANGALKNQLEKAQLNGIRNTNSVDEPRRAQEKIRRLGEAKAGIEQRTSECIRPRRTEYLTISDDDDEDSDFPVTRRRKRAHDRELLNTSSAPFAPQTSPVVVSSRTTNPDPNAGLHNGQAVNLSSRFHNTDSRTLLAARSCTSATSSEPPANEEYSICVGVQNNVPRIMSCKDLPEEIHSSVITLINETQEQRAVMTSANKSCMKEVRKKICSVNAINSGDFVACRACTNSRSPCLRVRESMYVLMPLVPELRDGHGPQNKQYWVREDTGPRWTRKGIWNAK